MVMRKRLLAGNWKMNGLRSDLGEVHAIDDASAGADVVLCLPAHLIALAAGVRNLAIGAQDCHAEPGGAHTGGISAPMLADAGARWVILGHSECRAAGLGSAQLAAKVSAASAALKVILCVGEREQAGARSEVVDQLLASLPGQVDPAALVIAYEPVWAIGSGSTPTIADITAMHAALRSALVARFGEPGAAIPILYGGSVTHRNSSELLASDEVDGLLVGGASLKAASFVPIVETFRPRRPG